MKEVGSDLSTSPFYYFLKDYANEGGIILEPGAGSGRITLYLARKFSLMPILLDYSKESISLEQAFAAKLDVDAESVRGDVRRLPFRDDVFDIVWNEGVNEHFKGNERQRTFDEMTRVVKYDGVVTVFVPNAYSILYKVAQKVRELRGVWTVFERPFSPPELVYRMQMRWTENNT